LRSKSLSSRFQFRLDFWFRSATELWQKAVCNYSFDPGEKLNCNWRTGHCRQPTSQYS